ncbi:hypothetical protein D3C76_1033180 [compost metagenome]
MFFNTPFYAEYCAQFKNYFTTIEEELRRERRNDQNVFSIVKGHVLFNDILSKPALAMHAMVREELRTLIDSTIPDFSRKTIFQKAMIEAWSLLCAKFIANGIPLARASHYITIFVANSFPPKSDLFDERHLYLQDTIFSGSRIKVTKSAKRQIVRLLLSNADKTDSTDSKEQQVISELAKEEVGSFINQMREDNLPAFERERLYAAELDKSREMKEFGGDSSKTQFDTLVGTLISENLTDSFNDLVRTLKAKDFIYSKSEEFDEEL